MVWSANFVFFDNYPKWSYLRCVVEKPVSRESPFTYHRKRFKTTTSFGMSMIRKQEYNRFSIEKNEKILYFSIYFFLITCFDVS